MIWYEDAVNELDTEKTYTHSGIIIEFQRLRPDLSENTFNWGLSALLRKGDLVREGYDAYRVAESHTARPEYVPEYSAPALTLMQDVRKQFLYVEFTVFETRLMNEFLNHLIGVNTIFLQVEKMSGEFIFRSLQNNGYTNILYKPSQKEFDLYRARDVIVITDLLSESPMRRNDPQQISLEKLLVDMYCDRLIKTMYSRAEYPAVVESAGHTYRLDKRRTLRYARRRNKEKEIGEYLERETHWRTLD